MKKIKLTALAAGVATVLSAGGIAHAADEVKVYGQLRVSIDSNSSDFGAGKKGVSLKSNASRVGVKGKLDSYFPDTSIIYQAELRYGAADEKNAEIEWREGYVGLASKNWGTLKLGRVSVGYKKTLTTIDPWNDNIPQSRQGGQQGSSSLHSSYFNNTIDYTSPKFNGVQLTAFYATQFDGEGNATYGTGTAGGKGALHNAGPINNYIGGSASGAGLKYSDDNWFVGADVVSIDADGGPKVARDAASGKLTNGTGYQVGARYKFGGGHSVAAFYEDVSDLNLGTNVYVNGIYKMGHARFIATYGKNDVDSKSYYSDDSDTYSLGVKYNMNKKSEVFIAYNNRSTGNKDYTTVTAGINAKFGY